ncbi:hypothetical protein D3C75_1171870 [compost metagenome]
MRTAHEQRVDIKKRIRTILSCDGETAEDVLTLFCKPHDVIWNMPETQFKTEVESLSEEIMDLMTV